MLTITRETENGMLRDHNADALPELLADAGRTFWLDLEAPTPEEFGLLASVFQFHPLAVEDAANPRQRPKVDEYEAYSFFVIDSVSLNVEALKRSYRQNNPEAQAVTARQVSMFLGSHYLVTVHHDPVAHISDLRERCLNQQRLLEHGVDYLLYTLLDSVIDGYFPLMDELEDALDALENSIIESADDADLKDLFDLKRELTRLRKRVSPLREVLQTLMTREFPGIQDATLPYLRDVDDHLFRIYETLDLYRDMTSNLLDAYLSQKSNELNVAMRKLSAVSLIFLPLTFLTGLFGMNFARMPWAATNPLYWMALMVTLATAAYAYFRYQRWL